MPRKRSAATKAGLVVSKVEPNGAEKRRHRRIHLSVPARFLASGGTEQKGQLLDISVGGVAIESPARPSVGTPIIVYIDEVGRTEGEVVRHLDNGFAVAFNASQAKRERLADRLTALANRGLEAAVTADALDLAALGADGPKIVLKNGREIACRVIALSVDGVSLEAEVRPPIGEIIAIGRIEGRVASHSERGLSIAFLNRSGGKRPGAQA